MLKNERGFTLLEILIVIVIIGILATIIAPGLKTGRERAQRAQSQQFDASLYHLLGADAAGIWNLNEGSGSNVGDSSASGNVCNISGGASWSWTTGVTGSGIFLTSDDYLNCGTSSAFDGSEFTFAFWIKPAAIHADPGLGNENTMVRRNSSGSGFRMGLSGTGAVAFWTTDNGGSITATSGSSVVDTSRFFHIAVAYRSGTATIYLDGKEVGSGTGTYVQPNSSELRINWGAHGCDATYDNIRYYSQSLASGQVQKLYAAEKQRHNQFLSTLRRG